MTPPNIDTADFGDTICARLLFPLKGMSIKKIPSGSVAQIELFDEQTVVENLVKQSL
jgi:hypothetical protein